VSAVLSSGCTSRQIYESPARSSQAAPPLDAVNINTATVADLEALPHIGPKTAEAIVKFRDDNGPFRRIEYLMQIRGISEKRLAELRPFIKAE
jgi:competence protein ComEA